MVLERSTEEPTPRLHRAQDLQYAVFWSIVGPFVLVSTLSLAAGVLLWMSEPNSISLASSLGSVLFYCSLYGALLTAHAFALFGLLGVLVLPWLRVKRKMLTLCVCVVALCAAVPVLGAIYFNYNFLALSA